MNQKNPSLLPCNLTTQNNTGLRIAKRERERRREGIARGCQCMFFFSFNLNLAKIKALKTGMLFWFMQV